MFQTPHMICTSDKKTWTWHVFPFYLCRNNDLVKLEVPWAEVKFVKHVTAREAEACYFPVGFVNPSENQTWQLEIPIKNGGLGLGE